MPDKPEHTIIPKTTGHTNSDNVRAEISTALTNPDAKTTLNQKHESNEKQPPYGLPRLEIVSAADSEAERIAQRQSRLNALSPEITVLRGQAETNAKLRADGKPIDSRDVGPAAPSPSDTQVRPEKKPGDRTEDQPEKKEKPVKFDESNYDQAVAEAKRQNKPLVLDFGFPGCPHCQQMDRHVWPDPKVQQLLNDKAIFVHVNIENAPQLANQYGTHSYPTTVITRPGEKEMRRIAGSMPPSQLRSILGDYLK